MIAVVDAGPLYAAADADDPVHLDSLRALSTAGLRRFVPILVVTEVAYFIGRRLGPLAEATSLDALPLDFVVEAPTTEDWGRMAELVRAYRDFPLGTADASVVALAERLGTDLIITLDQRHFRAIKPRHVESFRLLPESSDARW